MSRYNGHPDYRDHQFELSGHRAVVIGNGNVAPDVAGILTADIDHLRRGDIADPEAPDILGGRAVTGIRFSRNRTSVDTLGKVVAEPTGEEVAISCDLTFRAADFRGSDIPGPPVDTTTGRQNDSSSKTSSKPEAPGGSGSTAGRPSTRPNSSVAAPPAAPGSRSTQSPPSSNRPPRERSTTERFPAIHGIH